jgi:hypothetical protein
MNKGKAAANDAMAYKFSFKARLKLFNLRMGSRRQE